MSSTKSFNTAFNALRNAFIALLWILLLTVAGSIAAIIYVVRAAEKKVYVISPTTSLVAESDYDHHTTRFEIRNHVKAFCNNMFSWDKDSYNAHIEMALNLAAHADGLNIFNTFKENEVYENLVSTNARVSVHMDSLYVNMDREPFQGKFFLSQTWQTAAGSQKQGIAARFEVVPTSRSDSNPFGLILQKITFIEYKTVQ